jgi:hypothetical protein
MVEMEPMERRFCWNWRFMLMIKTTRRIPLNLGVGRLGLPNDYYSSEDTKRGKNTIAHIARMLQLPGESPETRKVLMQFSFRNYELSQPRLE